MSQERQKHAARHPQHEKRMGLLTRGTRANKILVLIVLVAVMANAAYYVLSHVEGPSAYADDPNYLFLASQVVQGTYTLTPGYIFTLRMGQFLPISVFYYLFGVSNLTSTSWDILSYLGTVFATFLLVRKLYNNKAALISAFLVSIFPEVAIYAVNTSEDVPLMFIGLLALLFFIYAKDGNKKKYYFASGAMLIFAWTTSYEGGVVILFMTVYVLIELARKRITINRNSIFFVYGIAVPLLLIFIYSSLAIHEPFIMITRNLGFYSAVGTHINGLATIPTTDEQPFYYFYTMAQYGLFRTIFNSGSVSAALNNLKTTFTHEPQNYDYGLYFYIVFPAIIALLALREKRAYILIGAFTAYLLTLSFGPMHLGIHLSPFGIDYLVTYRLIRFIIVLVPAMAGIMGIAFAKVLEAKRPPLRYFGLALVLLLLAFLYFNNYMISSFFYWWQMYPESLVLQAANYLRYNVAGTPTIYIEAWVNNATVPYSGADFPAYYGDPSTSKLVFQIDNRTNCTTFNSGGYVVWSGQPKCANWVNVFNVTTPTNIPAYYLAYETSSIYYPPTNVYYVK